jgi:hypothetical protein
VDHVSSIMFFLFLIRMKEKKEKMVVPKKRWKMAYLATLYAKKLALIEVLEVVYKGEKAVVVNGYWLKLLTTIA